MSMFILNFVFIIFIFLLFDCLKKGPQIKWALYLIVTGSARGRASTALEYHLVQQFSREVILPAPCKCVLEIVVGVFYCSPNNSEKPTSIWWVVVVRDTQHHAVRRRIPPTQNYLTSSLTFPHPASQLLRWKTDIYPRSKLLSIYKHMIFFFCKV